MNTSAPAKLPRRSEVPTEQTWDLSSLFSDFDAWEKALASFPSDDEIDRELTARFKGKLGTSPQVIADALAYRNALSKRIENLYTYAGLRNSEDVADTVSTAAKARASMKYAAVMAQFSFLSPELLAVKDLAASARKDPLTPYAYELTELLRMQEHVLSEREEEILTRLSSPLSKFGEIHSKWNNVDMKFPSARDAKGNEHLVSLGRFGLLLASQDRTLRKNAFEALYGEVTKMKNTIAANFYAKLLSGSTVAKIRKFEGFRASQLHPDNIPLAVYDNLVGSVRANLPLLHRSMGLRKRVLKLDSVHLYDRYVTLAKVDAPTQLSLPEARDLVIASLAPLGDEYVDIARKGLTTDRWLDWAENEGKRSGAFSWGTYESNPVMMQTWTGSLSDLFTLAHELGHSMHSYLANRAQPYQTAGYTIFVAEVASTLNEALLSDHILTKMQGSAFAQEVMSHWLQGFEGTVLRQTLFATFERDASEIVDRDEPLTPEALDALYMDLNKEWYGEHSAFDASLASEWMRIPHFYNTFYVYKYATSYCASLALAETLKANPSDARAKIMRMLRAGGSKAPIEILQDAGVDFLTPAPVDNAFKAYARYLDLATDLFGRS